MSLILEHLLISKLKFHLSHIPSAFLVYFRFNGIAHDIKGDYDAFLDRKAKNPSESM